MLMFSLLVITLAIGVLLGMFIANRIDVKNSIEKLGCNILQSVNEIAEAINSKEYTFINITGESGGTAKEVIKNIQKNEPSKEITIQKKESVDKKPEVPDNKKENDNSQSQEVISNKFKKVADADGFASIKIQFYGQYSGEDSDFTVCLKVKPIEFTKDEINLLGGNYEIISKNYTKFQFKILEQDQLEILNHDWGNETHIMKYNSTDNVWEFKDIPDDASMSLDDDIAENISKDKPEFEPSVDSYKHCIYANICR